MLLSCRAGCPGCGLRVLAPPCSDCYPAAGLRALRLLSTCKQSLAAAAGFAAPLRHASSTRSAPAALLQTAAEGCYFLFDCPGQVELFTLHSSLRRVLDTLTSAWHYRLAAVQVLMASLSPLNPALLLSSPLPFLLRQPA